MDRKIPQIIWFVSLGLVISLLILVARPFPEALGDLMAYLLGGLAWFTISMPIKNSAPPRVSDDPAATLRSEPFILREPASLAVDEREPS